MKSAIPCILAYILSVCGDGIFGKVFNGSPAMQQIEYPTYLKHVFMLGAFVVVVTIELYPYMIRKLPEFIHFLFEFFVSLFIFDIVCVVIWHSIVYTLLVTMPQFMEEVTGTYDCCCYQSICTSDKWPYKILLHLLAIIFTYSVFYSYGILPALFKGKSMHLTSRWSSHLKRIHHGIMCTDDKSIEECRKCKKIFNERDSDKKC